MTSTGTGGLPDWQRRLKDDIGENPARFLDRRIPNPPPQNSMFRARLRGIDRIRVVGAWIATEKRLRRGISEDDLPEGVTDPHAVDIRDLDVDPGRDHVIRLLEDRRDYLQEHGERPDRLDELWPHELPERYNPANADRPDYDVEYYWWEGADREEERLPWSERPTGVSVGSRPFGGPDRVATDGGDER